ncbi:MAG: DUF4870 domain-containing protein, partial [Actinomycetales bacterium]|nr:DUF4870 domain-containing protein [Actinomycetales bacterium]
MQPPAPPPYPGASEPVDPQDRTFATLAHAGTLVNLLGGWGFAVPLVILLVKGNRPVVRRAAAEALNFQISMFAYAIVSVPLLFFVVGWFTLAAVVLLLLIMPIVAAVKTNEGQTYRYPVTFRLVK